MRASKLKIVVTGLIGQHYTLAGVTWDYIQYVIGLKNLGHEVYYLEDSGEWPYNLDGGPYGDDWVARDCSKNINYLDYIFRKFDLGPVWAYRFPLNGKWYGLPDEKRRKIIKEADLVINVSGTLEKPEEYITKKKIYIDSDPAFTQVKMLLGDQEFSSRVAAHEIHFSFGEKVNEAFPDTGYVWRPTRSPIVVDLWTNDIESNGHYSTIMNWTSYKPLKYKKHIYGQKDREFVKFVDLPAQVHQTKFVIALSETVHENWQSVLTNSTEQDIAESDIFVFQSPSSLLKHHGWQVVSPRKKCGNHESYRSYIQQSRGEWSVAKSGYVISQSGWFSCRSSCYLASGRPVVVQDTGLAGLYPLGEGLFAFNSLNSAVEAIQSIESDYSSHATRARELAEAYFNSDKVLKDLIDRSFE
jgi:hypothetical protein